MNHARKATTNTQTAPDKRTLGLRELVILTASLWALNAFAIDMMLPALGTISSDLGVTNNNDRQLMIVVYIIANGFAQLFFGPIVDRFGRRPVMLWALSFYILASVWSIFASGFTFMLFARAVQGSATAATRVASIALVRDHVAGREMAKVMSLVITIFMAAPIIAPAIGQGILMVGPWRWIFGALMVYGLVIGIWIFFRIPETMEQNAKSTMSARTILGNYVSFFSHRTSAGYTIAGAFIFASLFAFISTSEQLFIETFEVGDYFALAFAAVALPLAVSSIINSRLVEKYGMRRISHTSLIAFIVFAGLHCAVFFAGIENFWLFEIFMGLAFFCLGLFASNCTSIAMEPMGHIAGSAGAANGFASTAMSGIIGGSIGQAYDGTPGAIITAMLALGVLALLVVLYAERGHLFEPVARNPGDEGKPEEGAPNNNRTTQ